MIYMYALGYHDVYITLELASMGMWNFSPGENLPPDQRASPYYCSANPLQLSLLQTGRQIYQEALPIFYGQNKFRILGITSEPPLNHFRRHVSEDHLAMITSICIDTRVDGFPQLRRVTEQTQPPKSCGLITLQDWEETWNFLAARMAKLEELEVRMINPHFPPLELTMEEAWVKPMLSVRGMKKFDFDIAQSIGSDQSTARYNEKLERFQEELRSSMCSPRMLT